LNDILALAPDAVILATGATMPPPRGFCDHDGTARDIRAVIADPPRGASAVLLDLDATQATYDAAELLAERFGETIVVTPRDAIARDTPVLVAQGILRRLAAKRVRLLTCHDAVALRGGTLALRHALTGETSDITGVDLFTYATARVPRDELAQPLRDAGIAVRLVGDALAPRLMLSAVRDGQEAADAL
jgi:hypothetical protein